MAACSETGSNDGSHGLINESVSEGEFKLEMDSSKEIYKDDEPIDISASLVYVGEKSTATILHAKPLMPFVVEQIDGDIKLETSVALAEVKSELKKDERVRGQLSNLTVSNGSTEIDLENNDEIILPEGEYEITVVTTFKYDDVDYEIPLTIQIKIES